MKQQLNKITIQSIYISIYRSDTALMETYSFDAVGWKYKEYLTGLTIWI